VPAVRTTAILLCDPVTLGELRYPVVLL